MKRGLFVILLLLSGTYVLAGDNNECSVSDYFKESIISSVRVGLNLENYSYSNISSIYCFENEGYASVNLNIDFKKSESDFKGKTVSVSVYKSDFYDFRSVFSELEDKVLDYTLKEKYLNFLDSGKDEEFYIGINSRYDGNKVKLCSELGDYFNVLEGEKYFNDDNWYCSIVVKASLSKIRELVSESVGSIYFIGDNVNFYFSGFSEGNFNLEKLSKSLKCDLSDEDYYYSEFENKCYGIYKDESRIYVSAGREFNEAYASISIYGINSGKGRMSVSAYGDNVLESKDKILEFVKEVSVRFLGVEYPVDLRELEWGGLEGDVKIDSLSINEAGLNGLSMRKDLMNIYFEGEGVYITLSEPYIQVYLPETAGSGIRPYYWGGNFVITADKVYSSVNLNENNVSLAVERIKEMVNPFIETGDWNLSINVRGGEIFYQLGVKAGVLEGSAEASQQVGVRDSFSSAHPDFSEFEKETESLIDMAINFIKGLLNKIFK